MSMMEKYKMLFKTQREPAKVYTMLEGRRHSLEEISDAIILSARDEACRIGHFDHTPEVMSIEKDAHDKFTKLLDGQCKIIDYRNAVDKWLKAGTKEIKGN